MFFFFLLLATLSGSTEELAVIQIFRARYNAGRRINKSARSLYVFASSLARCLLPSATN